MYRAAEKGIIDESDPNRGTSDNAFISNRPYSVMSFGSSSTKRKLTNGSV